MQFHIQCEDKDIAPYAITPGSHSRAKKIAERLEDSRLVTDSRGYLVFSGFYQGVFMTVCATGMGGPTTAIAIEELANMGTHTFIRAGSCGIRLKGGKPGDILIPTGIVRHGGTSKAYLPIEVPAVPTFEVLKTIIVTAEEHGATHYVGVTVAGDAFYGPRRNREILNEAHILGGEMEADTLFIVGQLRGWRTGALFTADGAPGETKPEWGRDDFLAGEQRMISIALDAMHKLAAKDQNASG